MTPVFQLRADGADISALVRDRMVSLRTIDEAGEQSDSLEVRLDDRGSAIAVPPTGAALELDLGTKEAGVVTIGRYTVDEIGLEGPPASLLIVGKAADMRASLKTRKTRGFDRITLGDLVSRVSAEHGLTPKVAASLASVQIGHLDQTEESDLHLLTRLARQYDAIAKPAFGHLLMVPRGEARSAAGLALPEVSLGQTDLLQWRMRAADRGRYQSVIAYWQDTGSAVRTAERAGTDDPAYTIRFTFPDPEQARAAARARLSALQRGQASLSLTTSGRSDLIAEGKLSLSGVRSGVDGSWTITRVEHTLDQSGWLTRINAEAPKR
jgi:hypothetical protein